IKEAVHLWKVDRTDFWMLIVTFIGTLSLGIEEGILIGVVLSLGLIIYQTTKPHVAILGKIPGKPHYKNLDRFPNLENRPELLILRFDARMYFANVNFFNETLEEAVEKKGAALKSVIFDADSVNSMDSSALHALDEWVKRFKGMNVQFLMTGVKGPVRDALHKSGLIDQIGADHFFMRIQHAVDYLNNEHHVEYQNYLLQTNTTATE
ncbi:MAG: STAS domain-containing protein, partial [Phaeodactylibacter sp.]|nr:STAS domain-containing protein [Phaeodactylibacter sp.]